MKAQLRRGACPSLAAPMLSGDGWLVRFGPEVGLSATQLGKIADMAARYGNGIIEITSRGSLQIRGLTASSAPDLAAGLADLGIKDRSGTSVVTGPLAGYDTTEIVDPRPLAGAIRDRIAQLNIFHRLGPKVSVTVDGGGALPLDEIVADVRLHAFKDGAQILWRLRIGGDAAGARALGNGNAQHAVAATIAVLDCVARKGIDARARDLDDRDLATIAAALNRSDVSIPTRSANPVGLFTIRGGMFARGYGLAFGQATSDAIGELAAAAGTHEFRLAPNRGLLALNLAREEEKILTAHANRLGFITESGDPRLAVITCAGAPACASAHLMTKALAEDIVSTRRDLLDGSFRLHVSGCAKRCAQPSGPNVTVVGHEANCEIVAENVALAENICAILLSRGRAHLSAPPG